LEQVYSSDWSTHVSALGSIAPARGINGQQSHSRRILRNAHRAQLIRRVVA